VSVDPGDTGFMSQGSGFTPGEMNGTPCATSRCQAVRLSQRRDKDREKRGRGKQGRKYRMKLEIPLIR
jgi:hypothetical protein